MEPGKQRARAAGRGERAPFPQNRPPASFRALRSGLRRIRPHPPLRLTVHPQQHCHEKPCLSPRVGDLHLYSKLFSAETLPAGRGPEGGQPPQPRLPGRDGAGLFPEAGTLGLRTGPFGHQHQALPRSLSPRREWTRDPQKTPPPQSPESTQAPAPPWPSGTPGSAHTDGVGRPLGA